VRRFLGGWVLLLWAASAAAQTPAASATTVTAAHATDAAGNSATGAANTAASAAADGAATANESVSRAAALSSWTLLSILGVATVAALLAVFVVRSRQSV
jgi:hypothetical protein